MSLWVSGGMEPADAMTPYAVLEQSEPPTKRAARSGNGAIVYRGPSLLTGAPIVVVLTGLRLPSGNVKTGPMVQAWILNADAAPTEAVASGLDNAICGDCRHRSGSNIGRSCYVIWWLGPQNVYRCLDSYAHVEPATLTPVLCDKHVRFGAFGDPSAAPASLWIDLARMSGGWTGYTHHWRTCDPQLRLILMASVDSMDEQREAEYRGWRTFRVRQATDAIGHAETICPASDEAGHLTTCHDCGLCSGLHRNAKSVAIIAHGQRVKWFRAAV